MFPISWTEVAPGVWRGVVGAPEDIDPLRAAGFAPALTGLAELPQAELPFPFSSVTAEQDARRTVIVLPLEANEGIFGFGLQFMRVDHRGRTRYLRTNSDPKEDSGETHAPVPFYVSSRGYGLLVNSARIVSVYCGSCGRFMPGDDNPADPLNLRTKPGTTVEVVLPGVGTELYLFSGPTMMDVVRRYNLFCGGGALPPRWGLGFWHRTGLKFDDQEALAEAREYRKRGFPCDVFGLEPGWHTASYPTSYEWNPKTFPRPGDFVRDMAALGIKVNLWENPYVSPLSSIYKPLLGLSGSHTVWGGLAPDYSLPEVRRIVQEQHDREHVSRGVSGYKLDECDGSDLTANSWMFPAHAHFPSGRDGEQMRQVYGLLLQTLTYELFHRRDRRTYSLVRASAAGAAPLPYVLYSDLYDHRQFVRALINSGFSGLLWTPEIRTADTPEEWVRRMQVVCLSPMALLNAWNSATLPWTYPEVEPIILKYMQLRMRLLPYLYSAFARYHFEGVPPFRGLALEPGVDEAHRACDDEYMIGDSLLAAPLFAGEEERHVYLPAGGWYDFETGERFAGGQTLRVRPGLEKMPLYVREGAIIPLMPPAPRAPEACEVVSLELRHYGQAPGHFRLYDDDGETFAYERGEYRWFDLDVTLAADGSRQGSVLRPEGKSSYGPMTWHFV